LVTASYYKSFFQEEQIGLASARAGNVIGGGDWSADRIVPDAVRAFAAGKALVLRNPKAIRPWQYVLEPLAGYLMLCQRLYQQPQQFSQGWNFGPQQEDACSVSGLVEMIAEKWGQGAGWEQDKGTNPHEAGYLKLDCSKADAELQWRPLWRLDRAVAETTDWYKKALHENETAGMRTYSERQIEAFQSELTA
jgi:CDP-glucose 4,6-dehydratase